MPELAPVMTTTLPIMEPLYHARAVRPVDSGAGETGRHLVDVAQRADELRPRPRVETHLTPNVARLDPRNDLAQCSEVPQIRPEVTALGWVSDPDRAEIVARTHLALGDAPCIEVEHHRLAIDSVCPERDRGHHVAVALPPADAHGVLVGMIRIAVVQVENVDEGGESAPPPHRHGDR